MQAVKCTQFFYTIVSLLDNNREMNMGSVAKTCKLRTKYRELWKKLDAITQQSLVKLTKY